MKWLERSGFTLVELLVVLLIVSILASISVSVYTGYVRRAEIVTARVQIHALEFNAARYQIDLGEFPLSSSGTVFNSTGAANPETPTNGCGYLTMLLLHSWSANALQPANTRWFGPYLDFRH